MEIDERQRLMSELDAQRRQIATLTEENERLRRTWVPSPRHDLLAAEYALLMAHVPAGIAFVDRDLVFRFANAPHARFLGLPIEAFIDKHVTEVFPEAAEQTVPLLERVLQTGEPFKAVGFPFVYERDGAPHTTYWDFSYYPLLGEDGLPVGVFGFSLEVSERVERERLQREHQAAMLRHASQLEQANQRLKKADQYKDEFLSVMSHELRTPLNFITGFASVLVDELEGPLNGRQRESVLKIVSGAERMLSLVNDLLDFSKIRAGKLDLMPALVPYPALIDEVVGTLRPLADQKAVSLQTALDTPAPVWLDPQRVIQVLTNLLSNAIKFTGEGGRVTVRAHMSQDGLLTEIEDTGIGIAESDLPRLFTRFEQLDMSYTRAAAGTGLGLAIAKALVEAHGGSIGVMSCQGRGSTFWFRLPGTPADNRRVFSHPAEPAAAARPHPDPRAGSDRPGG